MKAQSSQVNVIFMELCLEMTPTFSAPLNPVSLLLCASGCVVVVGVLAFESSRCCKPLGSKDHALGISVSLYVASRCITHVQEILAEHKGRLTQE